MTKTFGLLLVAPQTKKDPAMCSGGERSCAGDHEDLQMYEKSCRHTHFIVWDIKA